ncbi:hypothetical protein NMG60_11034559 [Bertholletia excelsa]
MEWAIEIDKKVQALGPDPAQWRNWSIYKIPSASLNSKKKAYTPQMVSFGPYHHGKKRLSAMEEHKQRALLRFLKRTRTSLQSICHSLVDEVQKLKDSYDSLDDSWCKDTESFLQLMVVDGCFMLEILRVACANEQVYDYLSDDPVFSNHGKLYVLPFIRPDMLLLENQLPMLVLIKLFGTTDKFDSEEKLVTSLNELILKFCNQNFDPTTHRNFGKCLHVLDLHRKSLLGKTHSNNAAQPRSNRSCFKHVRRCSWNLISCLLRCCRPYKDMVLRSATELHEAGIRFKKSESLFLDDISFKGGILKLPIFVVDDMTESTFLNLVAFERCHVGAGHEVTSFICFMDNIVEGGRDISHLCSVGVLQNVTGSDKTAATLFNTMTKDLTMQAQGQLCAVEAKVARYCKKPWNKWRANFVHTYLRSPWAIISVVAGILLFGLTIVQTVYTIMQG